MTEIINICAYRATDNYATAIKLHESHTKIMDQVGLSNVTSLDSNWISNDNAYFIIAELASTKEIIAGARVQIKGPTGTLPIEKALSSIGKNFTDHFPESDVAEFCGLWVSKKFASLGLSFIYMSNAIVSVSYSLGIQCLVGICAKRTADASICCGFDYDYSFGNDLVYPNPGLLAYIMAIRDLPELNNNFEQKNNILELIEHPTIRKTISEKVKINYNLKVQQEKIAVKLQRAA